MAPTLSHKSNTLEPGAKLGESDPAYEIRLEAEGAKHALPSPQKDSNPQKRKEKKTKE